MRRPWASLLVVGMLPMLLLSPVPADAQASLTDTLAFLLTNQAVATGDVERDQQSAEITSANIARLLLAELTTTPLSSGSGGFTYRFNPAIGTVERATSSFGPFFTERSLTIGSGTVSIGGQVQIARYSHLDDHDLRDGTFVTTANQFRDETEPFDVETLTLGLTSASFTAFASAGVLDRVDLGVAIPFVWLSLDGSRLNVYRGSRFLQARASADAAGFGDIAIRGKVNLFSRGAGGLAAIEELRLPTGREEDLLGAGKASFRTVLVASSEPGRVGVHGNVAATFGGLSEGVDYRGALTVSPAPRLTLVGELVGRHLSNVGRLVEERVPHPVLSGVDTLRLVTDGTGIHTASLVAGTRWNVADTWLVNVNIAIPITQSGLRSDVLFSFGLDYAIEQ